MRHVHDCEPIQCAHAGQEKLKDIKKGIEFLKTTDKKISNIKAAKLVIKSRGLE